MITAIGNIQEVLVIKLDPGEEVYQGVVNACQERGIKDGVILSGIGSLAKASVLNPVPLNTKAGYGYSDPIVFDGPIELTGMAGFIAHEEESIVPHIHVTLSDREGKGFGGHLGEGNIVLLTLEIGIGILQDIDLERKLDQDLDVPIMRPRQA